MTTASTISQASRKTSVSDRINSLRIVLIIGILLEHIPFNPENSPYLVNTPIFDWFRIYFGDILVRSGVPCLSAISGYLLFRNGPQLQYGAIIRTRIRTILLPFFVWNIGFYALVWCAQARGITEGYMPDLRSASITETANLLFALSDHPINLPLYFLRDLFTCFLLAPIVARAVLKAPILTLSLLFLITMTTSHIVILLRPDILLSFTLGATLSIHAVDVTRFDRFRGIIVFAFLSLSACLTYQLMHGQAPESTTIVSEKIVLRLLGMLSFWAGASWLDGKSIQPFVTKSSRYSFWLFCTHCPVYLFIWMLWNRFAGTSHYEIFYFGGFIFTLVLLISTYTIARKLAPNTVALLSGGR